MKHRTFSRAAALSLVFLFIAAAAFLVSPRASSQDRRRVREAIERSVESFDELTLEPSSLLSNVCKSGRMTLATTRGTFELEVEPFDIRADNYRSVAVGADGKSYDLPRTPSRSFRGAVVGMADTHVRLVLDEGELQGIIVTPDETYYIQPERDFSNAAGSKEFVFYAASSVKASGGECGTTLAQKIDAQAAGVQADAPHAVSKGGTTGEAFAPKPEAEIATEADFEFTQMFGGNATNANSDILSIMTQVDAIYDAQLGIKIRVVFQRAFTANNDPYTLTASGAALTEFRTSYNGSFGTNPVPARDLTHLFTGKELDGSTIGIAFIAAICDSPDFSYGLSQSKFTSNNTQRVGLTAHEMGHNFSASHPDEESPVPSGCNPSIMNSFIQTTDQFCQFSKDEITSHVAGVGGSCLTRLTQPGCTYSLSSSLQSFSTAGGASSVGLTAGAGCTWSFADGADWIGPSTPSGSGSATIPFTVAVNTNSGPRQTTIDIGGQKLTVKQAASTSCGGSQIAIGQTVSGSLTSTDCRSAQTNRVNAPIDLYTFTARAGQRIKIEMTAAVKPTDPPAPEALDTFIYLFGPDGSILAFEDDIDPGVDTDSRLPVSGFFTLPATGIYTIEATAFSSNDDGAYTLKLSDNAAASVAALSSSAFTVAEGVGGDNLGTDGTGFRVVTVTRTGSDTSGTASVDFATSDGSAEQRKDYEQTLGTLVFGPGETSKTFTVFVPDDRFSETPETINITLSNPVGMTLGTPSTATLTINSNDAANASSPVQAASFSTPFYVRQQYLDFLNREPDSSGFQFWQNEINSCTTEPCREVKRINVSAAFFLSIEFQNTGYLVERMYKVAYGDATGNSTFPSAHTLSVPIVRLNEFLPDTQRIGQGVVVGVGNWEQQLEANKNAFALEFVLRQRFLSAFPLTLTPAQFVDKLNQNAGGVLTQGQRDALVAQLTSSANVAAGRASVLRQIAENPVLDANEKNRAFVLMQFYGYLRRNPNDSPDSDYTGYDFWLQKLNQFGGNFVQAEMVKAFITSFEYIDRFGTRP